MTARGKSGAKKTTRDGLAVLRARYIRTPQDESDLQEARDNAAVARSIYELRTKAKLSQRELASLVGTTASVICRLEDADYTGHSLSMLGRIAAAVGMRVEVRFVRVGGAKGLTAKG